jgi:hypothetical protein
MAQRQPAVPLLTAFPLLLIMLVIYNLLAFGVISFDGGATANGENRMEQFLLDGVAIPLFSGEAWTLRFGDLFLVVTLVLLFIEIVKSTSTGAASVINHALSMLVFIIFLIEFVTVKGFGNSVFFLMTVMAVLDVIAGFTISIVAAKRDLGVAPGVIGTN